MKETDIIDRLVSAYNERDGDAFADLFAADAIAYEHPATPAQRGREEIRQHYCAAFARFPNGRTEVVYRVAMGSRVVDHERVDRGDGNPPFDCVAIYVVEGDVIARLDLVRATAG